MIKWLYWHFPIITNRKKISQCNYEDTEKAVKTVHKQVDSIIRMRNKSDDLVIKKVISSLMKLRENTWDVGRVDSIIKTLLDNFGERNANR